MLNEVSVSAVTFCPLRLMGTAAVLSGGRIRENKRVRVGEGKTKIFFFWWGGGAESALHITTVHQEEH